MNLYRSLLLWLALAVLGALGWHWFSQDLGDVVVRYRGLTYTTTLAYFVLAWGLLWFALWALWWLLRLPFKAWRRHAHALARNRLVSGLEALHQGRWQRAEQLLAKAATETPLRRIGEPCDIGGIAVHAAARVMAQSQPSEVLVSRVVTDLVAGAGLKFSERGSHDLKGLPGRWDLFAASA